MSPKFGGGTLAQINAAEEDKLPKYLYRLIGTGDDDLDLQPRYFMLEGKSNRDVVRIPDPNPPNKLRVSSLALEALSTADDVTETAAWVTSNQLTMRVAANRGKVFDRINERMNEVYGYYIPNVVLQQAFASKPDDITKHTAFSKEFRRIQDNIRWNDDTSNGRRPSVRKPKKRASDRLNSPRATTAGLQGAKRRRTSSLQPDDGQSTTFHGEEPSALGAQSESSDLTPETELDRTLARLSAAAEESTWELERMLCAIDAWTLFRR